MALSLEKAKRQTIVTSEIRLFTREAVTKAKEVVENPGEPATPSLPGLSWGNLPSFFVVDFIDSRWFDTWWHINSAVLERAD